MNAYDKDNFVRPVSAWNRYSDHFTLTKPNPKDYISIFQDWGFALIGIVE
jgi:hypothetical protein